MKLTVNEKNTGLSFKDLREEDLFIIADYKDKYSIQTVWRKVSETRAVNIVDNKECPFFSDAKVHKVEVVELLVNIVSGED